MTESEIRKCVGMDQEAIAVVGDGFTCLADGEVTIPPIIRVAIPENKGEVDVKIAYVRGRESLAIKIASGFYENYLPSPRTMALLNCSCGSRVR